MYIFQPDRFLLDKQVEKFSKYVRGEVLDVGAGQFDRYGRYFKAKKIIKMDVVPRKNVDIVGSADNIPLDNESIDSIVCTQVFEHLKDPFGSASEFYRVLKNGSTVLLTVPQINEIHEDPHDYFRYTNYGIKEIFEKASFEMIEMDQRGGYHAVIAQLKIRYLIDKHDLFNRPFLGKIMNKFFTLYGRFAIWLDDLNKTPYGQKHAIGWCAVFKKIK